MSRAELMAECPICFDPLHVGRACALLRAGSSQRSCQHFFHESCVARLSLPRTCPLCRRPFGGSSAMPDPVEFPSQWFAFFDTDGNAQLSFDELLTGLLIALPLDPRRIRADSEVQTSAALPSKSSLLQRLWQRWDRNGDGSIQLQEFMDKREGILGYLLEWYPREEERTPPPLTPDTLREWFLFWDEDGSGSLEKNEVTRALVKTLRPDKGGRSALASVVEAVWFLFDDDGNGSIEMDEFLRPDGLAETLRATFARNENRA